VDPGAGGAEVGPDPLGRTHLVQVPTPPRRLTDGDLPTVTVEALDAVQEA